MDIILLLDPLSHAPLMATATTRARQQRSTTSSGARTTTSPCKPPQLATSRVAARLLCQIPTSSLTARGSAAVLILDPKPRYAQLARPEQLLHPAPSLTRQPTKLASLSCGTRTTSARSPPTISSRAEC